MVPRQTQLVVHQDRGAQRKNSYVSIKKEKKNLLRKNIKFFFFNTAAPDDATMGPPVFAQQLDAAMTLDDGSRLELSVVVEGDPEPQITWLKNEQIVTSSDVVDLRYRGGIASLTIAEVFPEDEGEYVCTATNSIGTVTTTCKLTIKRKYLLIN